MRPLLSALLITLLAASAAADEFTYPVGLSYVYSPVACANGQCALPQAARRIVSAPVRVLAAPWRASAGNCANGQCALPQAGPQVIYESQPTVTRYYAAPSAGNCANGQCSPPAAPARVYQQPRRVFRWGLFR